MSQTQPSPQTVNVYWTELRYAEWHLVVAATEEGLCYVGSQGGSQPEFTAWAQARFGDRCVLSHDEGKLASYVSQLTEYLQGVRKTFDVPTDLRGTEFQQSVWSAMNEIAYGQTATYSQIAERIGKPEAVRAVGTAIGRNPALIALPCHRIVGKNGTLTGYRGGLKMKERLLGLESRR
ncbi:methylated-DNA--[protein]-cysteine S-methyltransferase [Cohnella yongneupensis]|uniref:Methylated-DNA--[protein]-cysteine S-methyltransferase n=1 Tax=Cohnella yongneupensis TaxID=425006 RepID=A0ABW0R4N3_9BACL